MLLCRFDEYPDLFFCHHCRLRDLRPGAGIRKRRSRLLKVKVAEMDGTYRLQNGYRALLLEFWPLYPASSRVGDAFLACTGEPQPLEPDNPGESQRFGVASPSFLTLNNSALVPTLKPCDFCGRRADRHYHTINGVTDALARFLVIHQADRLRHSPAHLHLLPQHCRSLAGSARREPPPLLYPPHSPRR